MPASDAYEYSNVNIGTANIVETFAVEYLTVNMTISQPTPHVLGLGQTEAYTNQQVDVYTTGCGTTQMRYTSVVQVQQSDGTWVAVPVNDWQEIAATTNAYTVDRVVDTVGGVIDPLHQRIRITTPDWSSPPHLPIRIVTHPGVDFTDAFHYAFEYTVVNVTT